MATSRSQEAICSLVEDSILELETEAGRKPDYNGVVVTDDTLLVIDYDARNFQVYSHDGKLLYTSHRLESSPKDVCLISKTEAAVCLGNSKILILSFKSVDDVKLVKTLDVMTGFESCDSVAKWNSDKLVVSGRKWDGWMFYWCVVNLTDGRVDSTHKFCKGNGFTHLAIKHNTVYISCWTLDSITKGVYAYDIFNPHTHKFLYQHHGWRPGSVMADERNFIYVIDLYSNSIHQLTDSGQLVTIHTVSSRLYGIFYDDQHGVLYTTSYRSNVVTVYRLEYLHQPGIPIEILNMDDRSIQLFEEALKDGRETVYSIRIMVVGHIGVGKTTLVKRLLGEEVNISDRCSTEGIDVYVNCCDVSLSTHEWTRRRKDSEQDYRLQRLARVLNEKQSMKDNATREEQVIIPPQGETTHKSQEVSYNAVEGKVSEVLYIGSPQRDVGQDLLSTASQEEESHPSLAQREPIQSETSTMAMLKLLQENVYNLKQDTGKTFPLTVWDFAGQFAFYTTHQTFLTRQAIYLLVSDVSEQLSDFVADEFYFDSQGMMKCKVHEMTEVWLNSIHSCAPFPEAGMPPVLLVGTHVDKFSQRFVAVNRSNIAAEIVVNTAEYSTPARVEDDNSHEILIALYGFMGNDPDDLSFSEGDKFICIEKSDSDWWLARNSLGEVGQVPANFMHVQTGLVYNLPNIAQEVVVHTDELSTAAVVDIDNSQKILIALYSFIGNGPEYLNFLEGDKLIFVAKSCHGWLQARNSQGEVGLVPSNYVHLQGYTYKMCERYFRGIRSYLRDKPTRFHLVDEDFAINNTIVDPRLAALKRKIVEVASQQPYWGEVRPARWIPLEQELMKLRSAGIKVIPWNLLEDLNKALAVPLATEELDLFLRFQHDIGTVLYFSMEILKRKIVLDPKWMIDALKSLITAEMFVLRSIPAVTEKWYEFKEKGKLSLELVDALWTKEKCPDLHDNKEHILKLMEQLNIIAKLRVFSEEASEIKGSQGGKVEYTANTDIQDQILPQVHDVRDRTMTIPSKIYQSKEITTEWNFTVKELNDAWQSVEVYLLEELYPKNLLTFFEKISFLSAEECDDICKLRRRQVVKELLQRIKAKLPEAFASFLQALNETKQDVVVQGLRKQIEGTHGLRTTTLDEESNAVVSSIVYYKMKLELLKDGCILRKTEMETRAYLDNGRILFYYNMRSHCLTVETGSIFICLRPLSNLTKEGLLFFIQHDGIGNFISDLLKRKSIFRSLPDGEMSIHVQVYCFDKDSQSEGAEGPYRDYTQMDLQESFTVTDNPQMIKKNLNLQYDSLVEEIDPWFFKDMFIARGILDRNFFEELKSLKRRERAAHFLKTVMDNGSTALATLVHALRNNELDYLANDLCTVRDSSLQIRDEGDKGQVDDNLLKVVQKDSETHDHESKLWSGLFTATVRKNEDENTDIQDKILPQVHDVRDRTMTIPSKIFQSKGVPCSDPKLLYQVLNKSQQAASSSQSTLEENCLSLGLEFHGETPANGNCLFEAVSSQLQRLNCVVQKSPQQLRQEVVAFMRTNRVLHASEGTIHLDSFIHDETFDEYCTRMAMDGEWADNVVVVAMARKLQMDFFIVMSSPSAGPDDIIVWVVGQTGFQGMPILLGHIWESHYLSLQPIDPVIHLPVLAVSSTSTQTDVSTQAPVSGSTPSTAFGLTQASTSPSSPSTMTASAPSPTSGSETSDVIQISTSSSAKADVMQTTSSGSTTTDVMQAPSDGLTTAGLTTAVIKQAPTSGTTASYIMQAPAKPFTTPGPMPSPTSSFTAVGLLQPQILNCPPSTTTVPMQATTSISPPSTTGSSMPAPTSNFTAAGLLKPQTTSSTPSTTGDPMQTQTFSSTSASVTQPLSVDDTDRFMHIACLLVNVGSRILRRLLLYHTVTPACTLDQYLAKERIDIDDLRKRKILNKSQMDILFPKGGSTNLGDYDITLLSALFTNIVITISPQELNMIEFLRDKRNEIFAHAKSVAVNSNDYQTFWNDICRTLEALSKHCNDPDFENEISREIQGIQVSTVQGTSFFDAIQTHPRRIETLERLVQDLISSQSQASKKESDDSDL